ncbi:hypothetical protein F5B20DRAFT_580839 [Whalleya microplaca]|nr:hypothetical protein F5B20DRAFT_580839 [Whalleya microplaca]
MGTTPSHHAHDMDNHKSDRDENNANTPTSYDSLSQFRKAPTNGMLPRNGSDAKKIDGINDLYERINLLYTENETLKASIKKHPYRSSTCGIPSTHVLIPKEQLQYTENFKSELKAAEARLNDKVNECNELRSCWEEALDELDGLKANPQFYDTLNSIEATKEYHSWRAQTGLRLIEGSGIDQGRVKHLAKRLASRMPLCISSDDLQVVQTSLFGLVEKATELAAIFMQSKPLYSCRYHFGRRGELQGFLFDNGLMEKISQKEDDNLVKLLLSPALVKQGSSRGDNYDEYLVLAKADVLC